MIQKISSTKRHAMWRMKKWQLIILGILLLIPGLLVSYSFGEYAQEELSRNLLSRTQTIATALAAEPLHTLSGSPADLGSPVYHGIKKKMTDFQKIDSRIRFVYAVGYRDNSLFFYGDSEPSTSPDYSAPGDIYSEASKEKIQGYLAHRTFVEGPYKDRWGQWVSGYAPLKDEATGEIVGMVGVDIYATSWIQRIWIYRLVPFLVTSALLIILIWVYFYTNKSTSYVTKLKMIQDRVEASESQLAAAQKIAQVGSWSLNFTTKAVIWSDEIFYIHGLDPHTLPPSLEHYIELVYPADQKLVSNSIKRAFKGEDYSYEYRIIRADTKEVRYIAAVIRGQKNEQGDMVGALGTVQDITERKRTELKLRESEKRFSDMAENIPGMIYQLVAHPDGSMEFLYVSSACRELYGLTQEQVRQDALLIREAVVRDDMESFTSSIVKASNDLTTWTWEGRVLHTDGTLKWLRGISQPERLESGDLLWNGVMIDVTDRKIFEEKLRKSEERLNFAITASNDGLFDMNIVKGTMYYSPRYIEMLGYTGYEKELRYTSEEFIEFIHPEDKQVVMPELQNSILNGTMWNHDYRIRTRSGEYGWFNGRGKTQINEHGKPLRFAGFITDITERREIEESKSEFVSVASHQLRTPLTSIKWFAELLGDMPNLTEEHKNLISNIQENNERMIELVNNLLNVSRIERKVNYTIEKAACDMAVLIESIKIEIDPLCQKKKMHIEWPSFTSKTCIMADCDKLREVLLNLVSNAVKYSPAESRIILGLKTERKDIIISVQDQGIGIPSAAREKIFSKFFRADNAVKFETNGNGLGLYIAKRIIEDHGGKLWFESVEGKGTTFYISLPRT